MKKLVCLLAVLALTASAFAADPITITGSDNGSGQLKIVWSGTAAPLGLAIVVDASASAQVASYVAASADSFFDVFIDYANAVGSTYVLGAGDPLANPNAAGRATPLPLQVVSVCEGHLQAASNASNNVAILQLQAVGGASSATVHLSADTLRGGIVNAAGAMTVTGLPADVLVTFAAPICLGDVNGSGKVDGNDLVAIAGLINNFGTGKPKGVPSTDTLHFTPAGDADQNLVINGNDLVKIAGWINNFGSGKPKAVTCPHSLP